MKHRTGFVSNSSSSSFIYIMTDPSTSLSMDTLKNAYVENGVLNINHNDGHTEFGWEIDDHRDFISKLNFAYLQAHYAIEAYPEYMMMLEQTLLEEFDVKTINWGIQTDDWNNRNYGFIDHQSVGDENLDMFEDKQTLKNFLFNSQSGVHTDNDNH